MNNSEWTMDHGNRCGHSPTGSTLGVAKGITIEGKSQHPKLLKVACEVIDSLFYSPKKFLSSLFHRENRKIRSEFREAICKVLKTIMKFTDLASGRICTIDENGEVQNLKLGVIAQHAGLSLDRCTKVWSHLMRSGLAKAQQRYEVVDGVKRGLASVKWLSVEFFESIGLGKWFKDDREKRKELAKSRKYRAQLKKQKKVKKTESAEQKMKLRGALNTIKNNTDLADQANEMLSIMDYDDFNKAVSREAHKIQFETNLSFNESYEIAITRVKRP